MLCLTLILKIEYKYLFVQDDFSNTDKKIKSKQRHDEDTADHIWSQIKDAVKLNNNISMTEHWASARYWSLSMCHQGFQSLRRNVKLTNNWPQFFILLIFGVCLQTAAAEVPEHASFPLTVYKLYKAPVSDIIICFTSVFTLVSAMMRRRRVQAPKTNSDPEPDPSGALWHR